MFDITKIKLTVNQITGNPEGKGILLGERAGYDYVDGKRTENQTHIKYQVVFPENDFEKVTVKVPGIKPVVTSEQLAQQGKVNVKFKNLIGKIYRKNSGEYDISVSADGLEVI